MLSASTHFCVSWTYITDDLSDDEDINRKRNTLLMLFSLEPSRSIPPSLPPLPPSLQVRIICMSSHCQFKLRARFHRR